MVRKLKQIQKAAEWIRQAQKTSDEYAADLFCDFCDIFNLDSNEAEQFGNLCHIPVETEGCSYN